MDKNSEIIKSHTQTITVSSNQTASYVGSGDLEVFSTPSLVALMENTAIQLIEKKEGKTTVGISIKTNHIKASAIGEKITCQANLIDIDGRKFTFSIIAINEKEEVIATSIHERVEINIEKFMSNLQQK